MPPEHLSAPPKPLTYALRRQELAQAAGLKVATQELASIGVMIILVMVSARHILATVEEPAQQEGQQLRPAVVASVEIPISAPARQRPSMLHAS